jgi:hypothetical protein
MGGSDTGGTSGAAGGGMGGEGGEEPVDPRAPIVTIVSPEALEHPDDGTVLTGQDVEVVCEATQSPEDGSRPVDPGKVIIELLDADGDPVGLPVNAEETGDGEFTATVVLSSAEAGVVSLRCSASDTSDPELTGVGEISTFYDKGPLIEVTAPLEDSVHPVMGAVTFSFSVTPDALVDDDEGAEVDPDSVVLTVLTVTPDLVDQGDGSYRASVDFGEPPFTVAPDSVQVTIQARNSRVPLAAERIHRYSFVLDGEGPIITKIDPDDQDVRGGEVELNFRVTDAISGVRQDTVSVQINTQDPRFYDPTDELWTVDADGNYTYKFNTTEIMRSRVSATITYAAEDNAGNASPGTSFSLYLDNVPPLVDMDPPFVREENPNDGTCSIAFDPVGSFAANDLERVVDLQVLRTLVIERANGAPGLIYPTASGTDPETVQFFVRDDGEPLLIDKNLDGTCDELDTPLRALDFNPIAPTGQSFFGLASFEPMGAPPMPGGCMYGTSDTPPNPLCEGMTSDLTRVIRQGITGSTPAIYARGTLEPGVTCTGIEWEVPNYIEEEGWFCVAARAVDNAKNVGISRPLRLCYDDGINPPADCSGTPPSCVQNDCTLPDALPDNAIFRP